MCCRVTLVRKIGDVIEIIRPDKVSKGIRNFKPSFNASPGQLLPLLFRENGSKNMELMLWGIKNSFNPDAGSFFNARMESVLEKKSFKDLMESNRAVLLTDGYFEWKKKDGRKIPYYIRKPDGGLLPMAALWDEGSPEKEFTVITREPVDDIKFIHDRMPAILNDESLEAWLDPSNKPADAREILGTFAGDLEFYSVSPSVNSTANNSPECIRRTDYPTTPDLFEIQ